MGATILSKISFLVSKNICVKNFVVQEFCLSLAILEPVSLANVI
jgi:hypothetical protein